MEIVRSQKCSPGEGRIQSSLVYQFVPVIRCLQAAERQWLWGMRIGICEDETVFLEFEEKRIHEFFAKQGETVEAETFEDGTPLLTQVSQGKRYDLILLDLQMQQSDGMEIAAEIRKYDRTVPIIFVTGVENRAVEGYHVDALDYVIKSELDARLEVALNRFMAKRKESSIAFDTAEGETVVLAFSDILWVESEKRGVKIVTTEESYYTAQAIGKVTAQLPAEQFMEVYKAVFVQLRAIKRMGNDFVEMVNGETLPLSRRKRKQVMSGVLDLVKGRLV